MSDEREAPEKTEPEPDRIKGVELKPGDKVTVGVVHYVTGTFRGTENGERGQKLVVIATDDGDSTTSSTPNRKIARGAIASVTKA